MNACEKLTARVYQNRDTLRISRDDFRAYLETAVSDSAQPDLLDALKCLYDQGIYPHLVDKVRAAIAKAEGRVS